MYPSTVVSQDVSGEIAQMSEHETKRQMPMCEVEEELARLAWLSSHYKIPPSFEDALRRIRSRLLAAKKDALQRLNGSPPESAGRRADEDNMGAALLEYQEELLMLEVFAASSSGGAPDPIVERIQGRIRADRKLAWGVAEAKKAVRAKGDDREDARAFVKAWDLASMVFADAQKLRERQAEAVRLLRQGAARRDVIEWLERNRGE